MEIRLETSAPDTVAVDALAIICFEKPGANGGNAPEAAQTARPDAEPAFAQQNGWLAELRASGEFTGKLYEMAMLHRPEGIAAKRLVLIGGGREEKFSAVEARRLAGALCRALKPKGIRTIGLEIAPELVEPAAEGAILGDWEPDKYKTDPKKAEKQVLSFAILSPGGDQAGLERARTIAEAQNVTRDLVNEPPNRLAPADLVEAAKAVGLECEVLDENAMREMGMGALLGVAQGSKNPPFLVAIKYRPSIVSSDDHLALVGKGVTFDTGGISIKPADGMEKMKYDMAGAAAVIGAMKAIAHLKPRIAVTGYIPTVENMLGGNAQRPSDIVKSLSGKTVEVLNTDAEGRLILADAITYANRNGATHIVDAATLTGAIGVALGHHNMGAFTNDQGFLDRVLAATKQAGEKAWQLPMDDEYKDYLKSAFADLPNIGGRFGGSITAGWFLKEFADPTPWVHFDIASTAWHDDAKPWMSKGPTGVGVRSFIELATSW